MKSDPSLNQDLIPVAYTEQQKAWIDYKFLTYSYGK